MSAPWIGESMDGLHRVGDGLRRMYLESDHDSPEDFLNSLKCPDSLQGESEKP